MTALRPRRGMASLELVLVAPFLLALATGLFLVGRASITKAGTATTARHDAFRDRETAAPGKPFDLTTQASAGEARANVERAVGTGYIVRRTRFTARTEARVIGQPWDGRAIPFIPPAGRGVAVNTVELGQALDGMQSSAGGAALDAIPVLGAVGEGGTQAVTEGIDKFALAFDPTNEVLSAAAKTGAAANLTLIEPTGAAMGAAADAIQFGASLGKGAIKVARFLAKVAGMKSWVRALDKTLVVFDPFADALSNLSHASRGKEGNWAINIIGLKKLEE